MVGIFGICDLPQRRIKPARDRCVWMRMQHVFVERCADADLGWGCEMPVGENWALAMYRFGEQRAFADLQF